MHLQHPTQEGRTYGQDWLDRIQNYDRLKAKAGMDANVYFARDLRRMKGELNKEYKHPLLTDKLPERPYATELTSNLKA